MFLLLLLLRGTRTQTPSARLLTCAEALLQEADLLAEGVDAVQLPEGVGQ